MLLARNVDPRGHSHAQGNGYGDVRMLGLCKDIFDVELKVQSYSLRFYEGRRSNLSRDRCHSSISFHVNSKGEGHSEICEILEQFLLLPPLRVFQHKFVQGCLVHVGRVLFIRLVVKLLMIIYPSILLL